MGMRLVQTQKQNRSWGSSCFPETEIVLEIDEVRKAIKYVTTRKDRTIYNSTADFIFCEIFNKWKSKCMEFYNDNGPQLSECEEVTKQWLNAVDIFMSQVVLPTCVSLRKQKRKCSWNMVKASGIRALTEPQQGY